MAIYNFSGKSSNVAVVITFKFPDSTESDVIILNTVDDSNIQANSTITEHPIVSGDMVADHMFKDPITMTIKGSFQYQSSSDLKALSLSNEESNLANIESIFERLKDEGILCEIVKVMMPDMSMKANVPRFSKRSNMVLQSINWTEKISTLEYSFSFRQVLLADVTEYDVDTDDLYLPNPTEPSMKSFAAEVLDWTIIDQTLYSCLFDFELMSAEFASMMASLGATAITALAAAVLVTGATYGGISALVTAVATAAGCSGPPGWIVGAVIAGVTAVAVLAVGLFKLIKNAVESSKYKIEVFKTYRNESKMRKEQERFVEFVDSIHADMVSLDDKILVYSLASDEEQQCIMTLDNSIYTFMFVKNNTNNTWDVKVLDIDDNVISTKSDLSAFALTDFSSCLDGNEMFRTLQSKKQVFMMRLSDDKEKLTSYMIMYSEIEMSKFTDLIRELILNRLMR